MARRRSVVASGACSDEGREEKRRHLEGGEGLGIGLQALLIAAGRQHQPSHQARGDVATMDVLPYRGRRST